MKNSPSFDWVKIRTHPFSYSKAIFCRNLMVPFLGQRKSFHQNWSWLVHYFYIFFSHGYTNTMRRIPFFLFTHKGLYSNNEKKSLNTEISYFGKKKKKNIWRYDARQPCPNIWHEYAKKRVAGKRFSGWKDSCATSVALLTDAGKFSRATIDNRYINWETTVVIVKKSVSLAIQRHFSY